MKWENLFLNIVCQDVLLLLKQYFLFNVNAIRSHCRIFMNTNDTYKFYYTPPQKSGGVLHFTFWTGWVSIPLSASASFPDSNLRSFWPIFFKLCMDIDIKEEWFWIANGLN